ncbi:MAG: polyisoprenoid-binding protein [Lysobacterales bacterium]|nr:MAG: polyisoprenoid-binding protein [Xanthomonadales bacterium]
MSRYAIQAAAILAGLLAAVEGLFARPAVYRLDPVHTQITFFVDHLGFSRASGRAYGSEGALVFDPEDWSRSCATVRIPVQRIGFGDARWDERMQRSDFFAAAEYPWIEFQGLWLERTGEREGILRGLLRLRGRDAPVELQVRLNRIGYNPYAGRRAVGFSARGRLSRRAFGMDALPRQIGDEVELIIEVEALREPPRALRDPPCQPQAPKDQAHAPHP